MSSGVAELKYDDQGFEVKVEVKAFALEELKVKIEDKNLKVYGEHRVTYNRHRCFLQKFKSTYTLPDDLDNVEVRATLNAQGILTIACTKSTMSTAQPLIRDVPITQE